MHALMDGWTGSLTYRQQRIIIVAGLPIIEESNLQYTHQSTHSGCTEPRQTSMWPPSAGSSSVWGLSGSPSAYSTCFCGSHSITNHSTNCKITMQLKLNANRSAQAHLKCGTAFFLRHVQLGEALLWLSLHACRLLDRTAVRSALMS